ncbi:MAG: acyltransferase [Gemmatimonadetes bacterium]|nr:acyltransferase [Gemmatimonadota bacterium]
MAPPSGYPQTHTPWLRAIGRFAMRVAGWKLVGDLPPIPKFLIVVAPHTSNADFFVGLATKLALDLDAHWFGKDTLFRAPMGTFMRAIGGRPVHRAAPEGMVLAMAETIRAEPEFVLVITPEGTRKAVAQWRTGFYHIAEAADIPIVPVWFDWSRKEVGIGQPMRASGDLASDVAALQSLYRPDMSKNRRGYWGAGVATGPRAETR